MNLRVLFFVLLSLAPGSRVLAQGALSPMAGPPTPAFRSLAQIEPRTPITHAAFKIMRPGSYYLTDHLVCIATNGIEVVTNNVDIDLNGFTIIGLSTLYSSSGIKIWGTEDTPLQNIRVRNGHLENFYRGLHVLHGQHGVYEDLSCSKNLLGVYVYGKTGRYDRNILRNLIVSSNSFSGIDFYKSNGNQVESCIARHNLDAGLSVFQGTGNHYRDSTVCFNENSGMVAFGATGTIIKACQFSENGAYGIELREGTFGGEVEGCLLANNALGGLEVSKSSGNRVAGNHIVSSQRQGYGIYTYLSTSNLFVNNSAIGFQTNYFILAGNTYGPMATNTGVLKVGTAASYPSANFSR